MADKKISELDAASTIQEGCCFPLVTENTTKKISFGTIVTALRNIFANKSDLDTHTTDTSNPHGVTAQQVGAVTDVRLNGTTVVTSGVANIPIVQGTSAGVVKLAADSSLFVDGNNNLNVKMASSAQIKSPSAQTQKACINPYHQHEAVFYGLAKAAGDNTQSASSEAVGTYTEQAKTAIKNMLGVTPEQIGAAAASDLTAHTGATNNPHNVTAAQVGAYTTEQVDDLLESASGHGTALASDADVNNIKTIGRYRVTSSAAAETITNIPTNVAGALIVLPSSTANNTRLVQIYIPNWATTNQIGILYIRQLLSGGWGDWYKLGDTTPTAIGSTTAGALNITDLNDLPKRDAEYYTLTGTETARITNKPSEITDGSIRVEVKFITGGAAAERCVQVLYVPKGDYFYQRTYDSDGWGSWYKFEGTVVS